MGMCVGGVQLRQRAGCALDEQLPPGAARPPGLPAFGGALGPALAGCSAELADARVHPLHRTAHQPCLLKTCEKRTVPFSTLLRWGSNLPDTNGGS